jgi:large conductance mechanosensitive channel
MKKFLKEFKEFAMKGNVVDMAVGVVIGAAFGKIVTSLVNDIIMPVVGVITGGTNFSEYKWVIKQGVAHGTEIITPEVAVTWGAFVQTIVDFLIIAFCIFLAIKFINKLKREPAAEPKAPAAPAGPTQEELLAEIRDLLRAQADKK